MMFEEAVSVTRLIESHSNLTVELGVLENLAHHLAGSPGPAALENLAEAVATLPARLEDHMAAEERDVYPQLVERLGAAQVESMLEDHREIRTWVTRLLESCARLDRSRPNLDDVRWTLLVVIGLVNLHLREEELAYVRVLAHRMATRTS